MIWEIDPIHSHSSFALRVMSVSTMRGRFKAQINCNDFGVGRGLAVQVAASPMVTIEIDLKAVQQSAQVQEAAATAR